MIIWLNGPYGSGKTTCAYELNRRLPNSHVYDPEISGFAIKRTTPKPLKHESFQDFHQWRKFNYSMLSDLAKDFKGTIIVPMTIINSDYYDELVKQLKDDGNKLRHLILFADKDTVRKRYEKGVRRFDKEPMRRLDKCLKAFETVITQEKIDTVNKSIDEVVEEIAYICNLRLRPDSRSKVRKELYRAKLLISQLFR
ncbi:MAG: AAA family ATPase [Micrococcaceae bacterium]